MAASTSEINRSLNELVVYSRAKEKGKVTESELTCGYV